MKFIGNRNFEIYFIMGEEWGKQRINSPLDTCRLVVRQRDVLVCTVFTVLWSQLQRLKNLEFSHYDFFSSLYLKKNINGKLEQHPYGSSFLGLRNAAMDVTQMAVLGSVSCLSVISPSSKWLEASLTVHLESGGLQ